MLIPVDDRRDSVSGVVSCGRITGSVVFMKALFLTDGDFGPLKTFVFHFHGAVNHQTERENEHHAGNSAMVVIKNHPV